MVNRVEYIIPAVHEKTMTPTAFLVRAIRIIPDALRIRIVIISFNQRVRIYLIPNV